MSGSELILLGGGGTSRLATLGCPGAGAAGDGLLIADWTVAQTSMDPLLNAIGMNTSTPVQIQSTGTLHMALTFNGYLWAWGYNDRGVLGNYNGVYKSTGYYSSPVLVAIGVDTFALGNAYTPTGSFWLPYLLYTKSANSPFRREVYALGDNSYGQLGDGTKVSRSSPVLIFTGVESAYAGTIYVYAAYGSSAIKENDLISSADNNATLYMWGSNSTGQLGDGTRVSRSSPVNISALNNLYLLDVANAFAFPNKNVGLIGSANPENLNSVAALSVTGSYTLNVYGWGNNDFGQIGDLSSIKRSSPVLAYSIGGPSGIAYSSVYKDIYNTYLLVPDQNLTSDTRLYGWGYNYYGQIGDGTTTNRLSPVLVYSQNNALATPSFTTNNFTCTLLRSDGLTSSAGSLYQWGNVRPAGFQFLDKNINSSYSSPVLTYVYPDEVGVSAGNVYSAGYVQYVDRLYGPGRLSAWGSNKYMSLFQPLGGSLPSVVDDVLFSRSSPTIVSTAVATKVFVNSSGFLSGYDPTDTFSAFIDPTGKLFMQGNNLYGQLGTGDRLYRSTPTQIAAGGAWSKVALGVTHIIAIKSDGTLWGWGQNNYKQVQNATNTAYSSPVQIAVGTANWVDIQTIGYASYFLNDEGALYAQGYNFPGVLGTNSSTSNQSFILVRSNVSQIAVSLFTTWIIDTDGYLWAWGRNTYINYISGWFGVNNWFAPSVLSNYYSSPVQVSSWGSDWSTVTGGGTGYFILKKTDNTYWGSGANTYGQLGDGTTTFTSSPVQIATSLSGVTKFACGPATTYALTAGNGVLYGWGNGTAGMLGNNSTTSYSSPVVVARGVTDASSLLADEYYGPLTLIALKR